MKILPELLNYDIYPKVVSENKETLITIKPLGGHAHFEESEYTLQILGLEDGAIRNYKDRKNMKKILVKVDDDKCIRFKYAFPKEQMYYLRLIKPDGKELVELCLYAVAPDLAGRYPFMGDLHFHTTYSDGRQAPEIAVANCRKIGYDFMAITDHERYYPSLYVKDFYKDVPIDLNLVPGEEIHLAKADEDHINDIHIVNFGGEYSINAMFEHTHIKEVGDSKKLRSLYGECPEVKSIREMNEMIDRLSEKEDIPGGIERYAYTACKFIFDEIRKANGLGIFCHPYWISNVQQVPETLLDFMMEKQPFDAFEVLGGENYFEHNGFQTIRYYEDLAKGRKYPIVASTDCHDSTNMDRFPCKTIVFSRRNERKDLISSIKDFYSVAIDTISSEYRVVGDLRLVKYATFLMQNYFPIHDDLCFEEGRAMKAYACGEEGSKETLEFLHGRCEKLLKKYFVF